MMAQRSLLRPDQLDSNGAYSFAQLTIDGYSGGDLQDGYLMGLILTDGYTGGDETVRIDAHDGAINQIGTGQVTFNGDVQANQDITIEGDLTVKGTTTSIETEQMVVTDPITVLNATGSEALNDWAGFSARDADGYNRTGWVFEEGGVDGYWALSTVYDADPDAVPDRAIAYIGEGDAYGDLSSTENGNSGADKIGATTVPGVFGNDVQTILENLAGGTSSSTGTDNISWTINDDGDASTDEDPCLIMRGGDGTSLLDGYLCLITDAVGGDRFQFQIFDDGVRQETDVHIGTAGMTEAADATLTFNGGNGSDAYQASISLDAYGAEAGELVYTANEHEFSGDVQMLNNLDVNGSLNVDGSGIIDGSLDVGTSITSGTTMSVGTDLDVTDNTTLGTDQTDTLTVNALITSDLDPTNCTYQLGDPTYKWLDGYFCMPTFDNITPVGNNYSLIGVLKGIDDALQDATVDHERGAYEITTAEAVADQLDSGRAADQGDIVDITTLTDAEFRDNIFVYLNGQLLYNDPTPAANQGVVQNDVARLSADNGVLVFSGNLRKKAIIQIVDMR